jgi:hypothetical protein
MAQYQDGVDITLTSTWDLSAKQYRLVLVDAGTNRSCIVASAAGDAVFGIVQNKPTSGQAARVRVAGSTKVIVGANVTRGTLLQANATGFAITGNSASIARALETATSGGIIEAVLAVGNMAA